jgi:transcriptional regulator with XRE-family HTH domain
MLNVCAASRQAQGRTFNLMNRHAEFGRQQLRALGRRMKELRDARRWSLRRMAKEAGVSMAAIQSVESGDGNPSLVTVVALAESLGEPVDRLIATAQRVGLAPQLGQGKLPDTSGELNHPEGRPRLAARLLVLPAKRALEEVDNAEPGFFYLLEGKVRFEFTDGAAQDLAPGDALHVAPGLVTRCSSLASRRSRILFFLDRREPADHPTEFA